MLGYGFGAQDGVVVELPAGDVVDVGVRARDDAIGCLGDFVGSLLLLFDGFEFVEDFVVYAEPEVVNVVLELGEEAFEFGHGLSREF